MALEHERQGKSCGNKHNKTFPSMALAIKAAKQRSAQIDARLGPKFCHQCGVYYVAALRVPGEFDTTDIEVLRYLATGLRDFDIARRMGVTLFVVRRRVSSMFDRTETNSRAQLVALAIHRKLLNYGELMEPD